MFLNKILEHGQADHHIVKIWLHFSMLAITLEKNIYTSVKGSPNKSSNLLNLPYAQFSDRQKGSKLSY